MSCPARQAMTKDAISKLNSIMKSLLIAAGLTALAAPSSLAQTGTAAPPAPSAVVNTPYVATMTFDVASVRENKSVDLNAGFTMGGYFVAHTATLHVVNWQIADLIELAFGVDRNQIVGTPNWPWPTLFVVEAKGNPQDDTKLAALPLEQQKEQQRHMLQALLEERFNLKTHWETREGDIYNLVLAKTGPKLGAEHSLPPSSEESRTFVGQPPPLYQKNDGQGYDFIAHGCPMSELVEILTAQFGRPVIDKTGLIGKYDFVLKYNGRWDTDRNADDLDPTPPLDRALQVQLGLKVEAAKGLTKVLVIDHIDKPSEN